MGGRPAGGLGNDRYVFASGWGTDTRTEQAQDPSQNGEDILDFSGLSADLTVTVHADGSLEASDGISMLASVSNVENLIGGSGRNKLDYSARTDGVSVDLQAGEASGFVSVRGFRDVIGSSGDDVLWGDVLANALSGGAGNDVISGGGGADVLSGGAGVDTLVEQQDADLTPTNTRLVAGGGGFDPVG